LLAVFILLQPNCSTDILGESDDESDDDDDEEDDDDEDEDDDDEEGNKGIVQTQNFILLIFKKTKIISK
jgi:hypothetical protein